MGFVESGTTGSLTSGKKDFIWNLEANGTFHIKDSDGNTLFKLEENGDKAYISSTISIDAVNGLVSTIAGQFSRLDTNQIKGSSVATATNIIHLASDGTTVETGATQDFQVLTRALKLFSAYSYLDQNHDGKYVYKYGSTSHPNFVEPSMKQWETSFKLEKVTTSSLAANTWVVLGGNNLVGFGTGSGPGLTSGTDDFNAWEGVLANNSVWFPDIGFKYKIFSIQVLCHKFPSDGATHSDDILLAPCVFTLNSGSAANGSGTGAYSAALDDTGSIVATSHGTSSALSLSTNNIGVWKWPATDNVYSNASAVELDNTVATLGTDFKLSGQDKLKGLGLLWKRNPGEATNTTFEFNIKINYRITA